MSFVETLFAGPWGPVIIFGLRLLDVPLSTVRMLLTVRNQRSLVPLIAFFEVLLWLVAAGNAIKHLSSVWHAIGYAGGFAAGNMVGIWLEEKLAFGLATVRIISQHGGVELAEALRDKGFGVTEFAGQGRQGNVEVVFTVAPRRRLPSIMAEVDRWDPDAFITVEEPRAIRRGWVFARRVK
jgi:uncharacterized protein YebE (UPF0316 family)